METPTQPKSIEKTENTVWHAMNVNKASRSLQKQQKPCVLWFTGLSAAGKSTVADYVEQHLNSLGHHTYLLDGDNIRHGISKDLGFSDEDRVENIRRIAEISKLMVDAGLLVIVSFISPFCAERKMARDLVEEDEFIEIFVDAPLEVCEARDPKGLYKRARAGEIKFFTGIDSTYEPPENAEVHLRTEQKEPPQLATQVIDYLQMNKYI